MWLEPSWRDLHEPALRSCNPRVRSHHHRHQHQRQRAGSLRQAVGSAQKGDTIVFDLELPATILLTSEELVINRNITISGPGANLLALSRAPNASAFRIFHIMPNHSVTIQGVTISNGLVSNSFGGGIYN